MRGMLVVNTFLRTNKFNELYGFLEKAAEARHITLDVRTNASLTAEVYGGAYDASRYDFVLFWDKDVLLASQLEAAGAHVFNSAESILLCDDKSLTWQKLHAAGIPVPVTIPAPKTFAGVGYPDLHFTEEAADLLGFPMVVKECFGSFGQQVYLCRDLQALQQLVTEKAGIPLLFQQAVTESFGHDLRISVAGGRAEACILRESTDGDFRSNLTLGGRMTAFEPTDDQRDIALRACNVLGLTFAGVDVLFGKDGPLICEVNSNAHFKTTLQATGVNMADKILDCILEKEMGR